MNSIRNDFQLIIKNSSSLLPDLINRIVIQTDYVQVPETLKFPYLKNFDAYTPNINSFGLDEVEKKMLAIINYTAFSLDSAQYSNENIAMLETLRDCKSNKIFECFIIKELIDSNRNGGIYWVSAFSAIKILTIFVFIVVLVGRSY